MTRIHHALLGLALLLGASLSALAQTDRPNFLWVLSEDTSIHYLKLYGAEFGATPNIDRLAAEGVTFNHAFSCNPVCSVARSTLMSGVLAPRAGFQFHRKMALASLPGNLQMWPAYLRRSGYYTSNNSKKDYNIVEGDIWDESSNRASWRKRPTAETPFFHMHTFGVSHEGSLQFDREVMRDTETSTAPEKIRLAPYHPDTALFRYTHARYFDRVSLADQQIGQLLRQLEDDGLLENTFIFYFGDHGGVLPRSKGYAYESGLHVPLVVRVPEKWRDLAPHTRGDRENGFVSFIDFGPTLLHMAGLEVPPEMDGRPFLGRDVTRESLQQRDETFGYADRFDEKYDMVRTFRKGRFKYIRNYQSFYPDALQNNYRYQMLAYPEWRNLYHAGTLDSVQRQFFEPRPPEQLFDVHADPHEVNDLSQNPEHEETLDDLRRRLTAKVKSINDLSFYPESFLVEAALPNGASFGTSHAAQISRLVDAANLALVPFDRAQESLAKALGSSDPWERYWGLITCGVFGDAASSFTGEARNLWQDDNRMVRLRAIEFLGSIKQINPMPPLYELLNSSSSAVELLLIFNTAVYLRDMPGGYEFDSSKLDLKIKNGEFQRRLQYLSSAQ